jgi:hypothetical protein
MKYSPTLGRPMILALQTLSTIETNPNDFSIWSATQNEPKLLDWILVIGAFPLVAMRMILATDPK